MSQLLKSARLVADNTNIQSAGLNNVSSPARRSRLKLGKRSDRGTTKIFACITPGVLARMCTVLLLSGLASCTGSPATLALQPSFEMMTSSGTASVSIRESPPGITDAEFTHLVRVGMERAAARGSVIAGPVEPPFPSQRIVWHVNLSASRGVSQLMVNVFDGANPFVYEQDTITNDATRAAIMSTVESMSERLLAAIAARASTTNQLQASPRN